MNWSKDFPRDGSGLHFNRFFGFSGMRPTVQLGKHGRHTVLPVCSALPTHAGIVVASHTVHQGKGHRDDQEWQYTPETSVRTFYAIRIHSLFHFLFSYSFGWLLRFCPERRIQVPRTSNLQSSVKTVSLEPHASNHKKRLCSEYEANMERL
jgi:hypothetical protein